MPLVRAGEEAPTLSEAQQRARKVNPVYAKGELVRVAYTQNQAESDLVQNILLEEGIPSMVRRSRGFDVPDFLAAGPRDVLVPDSGAQLARALLRDAEVAETIEPLPDSEASVLDMRIVMLVLVGGLVTALVAWLLTGGAS